MKLADMTFEQSRAAELIIVPEIEKLWENEKTADILNAAFGGNSNIGRGVAIKNLVSQLVCCHFDGVCKIFAEMNQTSADEVKAWPRSKANEKMAEMFNDADLISFFMSSEALEAEVRSATSQTRADYP